MSTDIRGRSAGCAAPPPPGCSNILGAMAGGRQDQNLNVTRKIFLALGVINSCVKPSCFGVRFSCLLEVGQQFSGIRFFVRAAS